MTREDLNKTLLASNTHHHLLELPTGFGKTKCALDKINMLIKSGKISTKPSILILIPRLVLIDTWREEIKKWGYSNYLPYITFSTYISIGKHIKSWDVLVADEAHHFSDRCLLVLNDVNFKVNYSILLSATVKKEQKDNLSLIFKGLKRIKVGVNQAINDNVLPEPTILLIPLTLDNSINNQIIEKKPKKGFRANYKVISYKDQWKEKNYNNGLKIRCTQQEYYRHISGLVEWYKNRSGNKILRNLWLHTAGQRLKWLAEQKHNVINEILNIINKKRIILFCPSIKESESFSISCINSKVGKDYLQHFNNKTVNKISAVDMIDEGVNLVDCQIGIFQMINSSTRIRTQRFGRILRHKKPFILFPYFINTREQEIIEKLKEEYNNDFIKTIKNMNELKEVLNE